MEMNITGPLENVSGSCSPDIQHPRVRHIQKKLLPYSWGGLGGVKTVNIENEPAVKRHGLPNYLLVRIILNFDLFEDILEITLETITFFDAALFL